jgi:hypothetical protein
MFGHNECGVGDGERVEGTRNVEVGRKNMARAVRRREPARVDGVVRKLGEEKADEWTAASAGCLFKCLW